MSRRRTRVVVLGLVASLLGGVVAITSASAAPSTMPLRVDFGASNTTPVSGYVLDYGQAYGARTGANQGSSLTYGWLADGTATPTDFSANGRVRTGTGQTDIKQTTFMHMALTESAKAEWELEVADGWYKVEVGLGDASTVYNSTHSVSVEGEYPIAPFIPNATVRTKTGSVVVLVSDGRLTVRPQQGTNVKITYLTIETTPAPTTSGFPFRADFGAVNSTPADGYILDYGVQYGEKPAGVYGWVQQGATEPLDLVSQGRQRATTSNSDPRLTNFLQMQGAGSPAGSWQMSLPNGVYRITVGVGEANNLYDSSHAITVNGDQTIEPYTPNYNTKFKSATTDVTITNKLLTVSAIGGANTKITFIEILDWSNPATPTLPLNVDFGTSGSSMPAGYLNDSGQPFGARAGGNTFGWVGVGTSTPLNMTANSRLRASAYTTDLRMLSLMQMQPPGGTPGSWEASVPNGTYTVEVAAGDASTSYDSAHSIRIENVPAITTFGPSVNNRLRTAIVNATVSDGRLTVDSIGGSNTKILYISISALDTSRPRVSMVAPGGDETDVVRDLSITTELILPNGAINPNTVNNTTVTLKNNITGDLIPASVNTSGGGDVLVLTPNATLPAETMFRYEISDGVKDITGKSFVPWRSLFKTGSRVSGNGIAGVAFTKEATTATGQMYTSVTFGPDGKLYAATLDGLIQRFPVAADGTLGPVEATINTVQTLNGGDVRTIIGLTFDPTSTANNLILWVTDNYMYTGSDDVPDWSSKLDRLTGANLQNGQNVLLNLPRSAHDHEANSIAFGPDGALYFPMGSNTGMGYQDLAWGNRPEVMLSGAVLRLDTNALPASLPLNVKTTDVGGPYNPYAAGAPLTLYATGVRNAFDLLWHSNGQLYAPTNGSAAGSNLPAVSSPLPASCSTTRSDVAKDGAYTYTGPAFNTIMYNPAPQTDMIHKVTKGGYYGHPNPTRCEFIAYGGNPTSVVTPWEDTAYPVGVPQDRNFRAADVYDAGMHASANGTIEFKSNVFGSLLKGKLLIVRYSASKDIIVADPSGANGTITGVVTGTSGLTGFAEPLDIVENPNGSGILYVTELGASDIKLLRPVTG